MAVSQVAISEWACSPMTDMNFVAAVRYRASHQCLEKSSHVVSMTLLMRLLEFQCSKRPAKTSSQIDIVAAHHPLYSIHRYAFCGHSC